MIDPEIKQELAGYRQSIDNIDAALVHMLAERFRCTQAVGVLKAKHDLPPADPARAARLLCRPFSSAAEAEAQGIFLDRLPPRRLDGLIVLSREGSELRMSVYNSDGSRAKTCGNGLRLLARLCVQRGHVREERFAIRTDAGPRSAIATGQIAHVELGRASILETERPIDPILCKPAWLGLRTLPADPARAVVVAMGNLHAIVLVPDEREVDLERAGSALGRAGLFAPEAANVEFAAVRDGHLFARVWERGVGETLSCGSGACAVAVAARERGLLSSLPARIAFPGGVLTVSQEQDGALWLEGPCTQVSTGRCEPRLTAIP